MPVGGDTQAAGYPAQQYGEYEYPPTQERPRGRKGSGRNAGFVLLGLVSVAVFAAVAYLVFSLLGGRGADDVTVPQVTGLTQANAEARLAELGLTADLSETASETVPEGVVAEQDPASGTQVASGDAVTLLISTGSANVRVPDVIGLSQNEARVKIEEAGLKVGNIETRDSADVEKDHVVATDPTATSSVAKGDEVTLILSTGQVQVPDVTGTDIESATKTLTDLGITVNREDEPSDQTAGTVLSQSLPGGSSVDSGSATITLRVAVAVQQPEPTVPPSDEPTDQPSPEPDASQS